MSQVVTFEGYTPPKRYDELPWTEVQIEEALVEGGPWTLIETIPLDPFDADPSDPAARSFTTELGTADELWYRVTFADADGDTASPTSAVQNIGTSTPYATVDEFFRIIKVRNPSDDQTAAAERVLSAAAG